MKSATVAAAKRIVLSAGPVKTIEELSEALMGAMLELPSKEEILATIKEETDKGSDAEVLDWLKKVADVVKATEDPLRRVSLAAPRVGPGRKKTPVGKKKPIRR